MTKTHNSTIAAAAAAGTSRRVVCNAPPSRDPVLVSAIVSHDARAAAGAVGDCIISRSSLFRPFVCLYFPVVVSFHIAVFPLHFPSI